MIKDLLNLLACPKCKGELIYNAKRNVLVCPECKLVYLIEDDIPILLIELAKPLDDYLEKH